MFIWLLLFCYNENSPLRPLPSKIATVWNTKRIQILYLIQVFLFNFCYEDSITTTFIKNRIFNGKKFLFTFSSSISSCYHYILATKSPPLWEKSALWKKRRFNILSVIQFFPVPFLQWQYYLSISVEYDQPSVLTSITLRTPWNLPIYG